MSNTTTGRVVIDESIRNTYGQNSLCGAQHHTKGTQPYTHSTSPKCVSLSHNIMASCNVHCSGEEERFIHVRFGNFFVWIQICKSLQKVGLFNTKCKL